MRRERRRDHPVRRRRRRRPRPAHAARRCCPALRERHDPTFVVVNGENIAGGLGITPKIADELFAAGVDVITLGNHTYHRARDLRLPRRRPSDPAPGQLPAQPAGPRHCVVERDGVRLGVVNLSGNVFLRARARPAFLEVDAVARASCAASVDHVLVDMHAEATSEKVAIGWHLDGRVTAVVGTHTHVPTADARVLPGGTAYITDVGMTGPRGGVIGVEREQAIESLRTQMSVPLRDRPTRTRGSWASSSAARRAAARGTRSSSAAAVAASDQRAAMHVARGHDRRRPSRRRLTRSK